MRDIKRATYTSVTDEEAIEAFELLTRLEGIIPAFESSHALAYTMKLAPQLDKNKIIIVNLSGRGDKDVDAYRNLNRNKWNNFKENSYAPPITLIIWGVFGIERQATHPSL